MKRPSSHIASLVIGWSIGLMTRFAPWAVPGRVLVTNEVVVLRHPRPISRGHLLILPRNRVPGLDVVSGRTPAALDAMLGVTTRLAWAHFDHPKEVVAVVNGGTRQDVRLLHMHLLTDAGLADALLDAEASLRPGEEGVVQTDEPLQPVHLLYMAGTCRSATLLADIQQRVVVFGLEQRGYSLMVRAAEPALIHFIGSSSTPANGHPRPEPDDAAHVIP